MKQKYRIFFSCLFVSCVAYVGSVFGEDIEKLNDDTVLVVPKFLTFDTKIYTFSPKNNDNIIKSIPRLKIPNNIDEHKWKINSSN